MSRVRLAIPSLFTLGNALCGFLGIIFTLNGNLPLAFNLILLAAFLDFWDGFLARKLGVDGEMGKQLDSLADVITFGALPSAMMFYWMRDGGVYLDFAKPYKEIIPFASALILLSSIWRLAKFNIGNDQQSSFKGLATPANAILIGSFAWSYSIQGLYYPIIWFNEVSIVLILFLSWLLNSKIRLFSFKVKSYGFNENKLRYLLILFSLLSVFFYSFEAVPIIILVYIVLSFIHFKLSHEI